MQRQLTPHTIQREPQVSHFIKNSLNHTLFKKYDKKKHKDEMIKINWMLEQCCERNDRQANLPTIFKFMTFENDNSETVYSLHLSEIQAEEIGTSHAQHQYPIFAGYIEAMRNAILKLKRCYFIHNDKNDVTAGVLSYLLCVIEHKLLHFKGDDENVTYVTVLEEFVNDFRFSVSNADQRRYLKEVNRELRIAKEYLIEQSESYDLKKSIAELWRELIWQSNALIHSLVKLVACEADRSFVDSTTINELGEGLLASETMNKVMSLSIFQKWITDLAAYYQSVIDCKTNRMCDQIYDPSQLFLIPDFERYKMDKEVDYLLEIFNHSPNFLTTQLNFNESTGESTSVPINDKNILIQRITVMSKMALAIQQMMTLAYLAKHVLNSMYQFNDIQRKIPRYIAGVLNVMDGMSEQINNIVSYLNSEFRILYDVAEYESNFIDPMYLEITTSFYVTRLSIKKFAAQIKLYYMYLTKNYKKDEGKPAPESFKYEMISVARMVGGIHHIPNNLEQTDVSRPLCNAQQSPRNIKFQIKNQSVFTQKLDELVKRKNSDSPDILPRDARFYDVYLAPSNETSEKRRFAEKVPSEYTSMVGMVNILNQIQKKIVGIKNTEKNTITRKELNAYIYLYRCLSVMFHKCKQMINEKSKDKARVEKAENLYYLILQFCGMTHEFLSLSRAERVENVHVLIGFIKNELTSDENDYLDDHAQSFKKYINTSCFKIFSTESREKISYLNEACDLLLNALTPLRQAEKVDITN